MDQSFLTVASLSLNFPFTFITLIIQIMFASLTISVMKVNINFYHADYANQINEFFIFIFNLTQRALFIFFFMVRIPLHVWQFWECYILPLSLICSFLKSQSMSFGFTGSLSCVCGQNTVPFHLQKEALLV